MLHKENKGTTDDILYMKQISFSVVFRQDVDECKESGGCKDKIAECHNTVGSFTCSCPKGYNSGYDGGCTGMCSFLYIHFNVHALGMSLSLLFRVRTFECLSLPKSHKSRERSALEEFQ